MRGGHEGSVARSSHREAGTASGGRLGGPAMGDCPCHLVVPAVLAVGLGMLVVRRLRRRG